MKMFEQNKAGCIKARIWLKENNLLDSCGPSDCDGITFITCANELFYQQQVSPYYLYAELTQDLNLYRDLLAQGKLRDNNLEDFSKKFDKMIEAFTNIIIKLGDEE
jgi:hypothetical protein